MEKLEYRRSGFAVVGARHGSGAAHKPGAEVREKVAIEVRGQDDVVFLWPLDHLERGVIHDEVAELDERRVLRDLAGGLEKQAVRSFPTFKLSGSGQTGAGYIVETSTNLADWATVTNLTAVNGAFEFDFAPLNEDTQRYFRARVAP